MDSGVVQALLIVWIAVEWLLRLLALFVVPRNRKPDAGVWWLLFIFLIPWVGWVVFIVFGSSKLPKNRRDAQQTLDRHIEQVLYTDADGQAGPIESIITTAPDKYHNTVQLSQALTHLPLFSGNAIEPIIDYDQTIARIVDDINNAHSYVQVEYYILALDEATEPLFEALEAAVERGVNVFVLYDAFGSRKYARKQEMLRRMKQVGIRAYAMLPFHFPGRGYTRPDLRNHRKIVVIDGFVGYTGSFNMIARHYHRKDSIVYDELVIRVEGPVVLQLEAVFLNDWFAETGEMLPNTPKGRKARLEPKGPSSAQVVPSGPGYEYENNRKLFTSLFYAAKQTITIVNPYFVPEQSLISALISAVRRGVKVRLINSEAIDQVMVAHAQRSYYEQMLQAGVEIYLYKKPTLLHSKFAIIDDDACFVGSSNMDIRSFELNQELTLTSYDSDFVARMQQIAQGYLQRSQRVDKELWSMRPPRKQLLDNIARLTSSLQ